MPDLSIGVIGAGGMGTRHAMNVHRQVSGARVSAIYDLDTARAEQVAEDCGGAKAFSDPTELIKDSSVDAVIIASPDATHAGFVRACLEQRKPVLCEKPLATSAADAQTIVEMEQKIGQRLVAVGLMRRFDPQHAAIKQVVDSGEMGRPVLFKGVHRNAGAFTHRLPGAEVIVNSAIHDLDSARWLLGQEVEEVDVRGLRTRATFSEETRDLILIQMAFGGNCLASIEVGVAAEYGYEVTAEIVAERGNIVTLQPDNVLIRSRNARLVTIHKDWLVRFHEAYIIELVQWIRSLQTSEPFSGANAWDGYMGLVIADACIEALERGTRVPVKAPARPELYQ